MGKKTISPTARNDKRLRKQQPFGEAALSPLHLVGRPAKR